MYYIKILFFVPLNETVPFSEDVYGPWPLNTVVNDSRTNETSVSLLLHLNPVLVNEVRKVEGPKEETPPVSGRLSITQSLLREQKILYAFLVNSFLHVKKKKSLCTKGSHFLVHATHSLYLRTPNRRFSSGINSCPDKVVFPVSLVSYPGDSL